jgi:hypothetical protein
MADQEAMTMTSDTPAILGGPAPATITICMQL